MSDLIDRVSKLLALADNAGTDAEREAAMEQAQKWASLAGIELAVARARTLDREKREEPVTRTVQVNDWSRRTNRKWFVELFLAVAAVNDLQCLISHDEYLVFPTGFPSDIDVAEALFASLALQMEREANAALKRGDHKESYQASDGKTYTYSRVDGRIWRANFYEGFIARVSSRLWQAKRAARREVEERSQEMSDSTAVALRDKKAEVGEAFENERKRYKRLGSRETAQASETSYDAQQAGQDAGARAQMGDEDDRAMAGGRPRREIGN